MKIFVPNESATGETRVALVPGALRRLLMPGLEVLVESQAGILSAHNDDAYCAAGAAIVSADGWASADVVLTVGMPNENQIRQMRAGAVLAGLLSPHRNVPLIALAAERGITALALEYLPRITRAQAMDALSSQANIAGYKAVLMAAGVAPKI